MTRRILTAAVVLVVAIAVAQCSARASQAEQATAGASQPKPEQKILEKNPEFMRLLNPPEGDEFLQAYSAAFRDKAAEIEKNVADISDQKLRGDVRAEEWSNLPKRELAQFKAEADLTFYQAKIAFLKNHADSLFEVGLPIYEESGKYLSVRPIAAASANANLRIPMSPETIKQIYETFKKVAAPEIDAKTREYVSKAGAGSMCGRNPEWCYQAKRAEVEQNLLSTRLIVVGQGDFEAQKIERLLLVDYETETVLQELNPHISPPDTLAWRFSTEMPPPLPPEPPAPDTQPQNAPPVPKEVAPAPEPHTETAGNTTESAPPPAPPSPPTQPTPADTPKEPEPPAHAVTAASITEEPAPIYPEKARAAHVQGEVVLHAKIDTAGKTSEIRVLSGDDLLAPAAVEAVRQWKYKPMLVDGVPTETDTTITITFSLNE